MSYSRFSVFEWQREAFAPLTTPQILIPYPAQVAEGSRRSGYFSGLRDLLAFNWKTGFAVAGIFAICLGLGFALLNPHVQPGQEVSAVNEKQAEIDVALPIVSPPAPVTVAKIAGDTMFESHKDKPVRAVQANSVDTETRRAKLNKGQRLNVTQIANDVSQRTSEPVRLSARLLSPDTNDDDRSLRLSDLFDEDGTKL